MNFTVLPPQASEQAPIVDGVFYILVAVSSLIILAVFIVGVTFAVRYRRGSSARRGPLPDWISREVEVTWTVATLFAFVFVFWFAASIFLSEGASPEDSLKVHVVGKQWMWKAEQPNGAREINEIHIPVDVPIRIVLTSQDVIHSLFLPAMRAKKDAVPGRYTQINFKATKTGTYNLFCAEYCGQGHAQMGGRIVVMNRTDYQEWAAAQGRITGLAGEGRTLFTRMGCAGCHAARDNARAPNLAGLFGSYVELADGGTKRADEAYLQDSILEPKKDVVAGYDPIMPSYKEALSKGELLRLLAYLETYSGDGGGQ